MFREPRRLLLATDGRLSGSARHVADVLGSRADQLTRSLRLSLRNDGELTVVYYVYGFGDDVYWAYDSSGTLVALGRTTITGAKQNAESRYLVG